MRGVGVVDPDGKHCRFDRGNVCREVHRKHHLCGSSRHAKRIALGESGAEWCNLHYDFHPYPKHPANHLGHA
jgi:hypothetical protein